MSDSATKGVASESFSPNDCSPTLPVPEPLAVAAPAPVPVPVPAPVPAPVFGDSHAPSDSIVAISRPARGFTVTGGLRARSGHAEELRHRGFVGGGERIAVELA